MNCEQYEQPIALYVEGDLSALEAVEVAAHLARCHACAHFAEELKASQSAFRMTGLDDLSETLLMDWRRSVMNEVGRRQATLTFWQRWFHPLRWQYATLVAVLLCCGVIGWWSFAALRSDEPLLTRKPQESAPQLPAPKPIEKQSDEQSGQLVKREMPRRTKLHLEAKRNSDRAIQKEPQCGDCQQRLPAVAALLPVKTESVTTQRSTEIAALPAELEINNDPGGVFPATDNLPDQMPPAEDHKIRMEIQTRDPNIRIIWLVNKESRRATE